MVLCRQDSIAAGILQVYQKGNVYRQLSMNQFSEYLILNFQEWDEILNGQEPKLNQIDDPI